MSKTKPSRQRRIAVIGAPVLQAESRFNAALIRYASQRGNWKFVFSYGVEVNVPTLRFLRKLDCDGALIRVISPAVAHEVRNFSFPVVNFSSWIAQPQVPTVRSDNSMIGRLAAEHLLEKGCRRFGVVLSRGGWFVQLRSQGFLEAVERAGFGANVKVFQMRSHPADGGDFKRFRDWVRELATPTGLFLTNDDPDAPELMNACRAAGKSIPRDLVVIAAYGHPSICLACNPPLSYVDQNEEGLALEAAKFLDRLMSGEENAAQTIIVPCGSVVPLKSTDAVALEDREVAHAVEFIRAHAGEPMNIKDVAQHFSIARRTLERRFRVAMGVSLHDYQVRERVERAKDLLRAVPPLSLNEVARRCGFSGAARLNLVFRRVVKMTPADWRRK